MIEVRRKKNTASRIPQLISSSRCLACDVCCRFPDKNSPLAPYFTGEEILRAIGRGIPSERFADPKGGRIELIPHPSGEGFICPAFDPTVNGCRIYEDRPLDCQLFPLALMWDPSQRIVLLGYDRKCPVVVESLFGRGLFEYGELMAARLETDESIQILRAHSGLVGAYQEDVMILASLPRLSDALTGGPAGFTGRPSPESVGLTRLTDADRPMFESVLKGSPAELSSYSWPALMIWSDQFEYNWTIIEQQLCLFVKYIDGLFMPIPPLGQTLTPDAVRICFAKMDSINIRPEISRIENIDGGQIAAFEAMGLVVKPKDQEYLYDRTALARLAGDPYKSKRWACNRFERDHRHDPVRLEPYRPSDLEDCLGLFDRWKRQKAERSRSDGSPDEDRMILEDAESAHRRALENFTTIGLTGRVLRLDGKIVGYTFGYPFRSGIFCVLLEVADRGIPGLSAYLFREFCREMPDFPTIHAMDDSGLQRLRAAKRSYHPAKILTSYIATR